MSCLWLYELYNACRIGMSMERSCSRIVENNAKAAQESTADIARFARGRDFSRFDKRRQRLVDGEPT